MQHTHRHTHSQREENTQIDTVPQCVCSEKLQGRSCLDTRVLTSPLLQCQQKIIGDPDQLMAVALECIYSCERDDQLSLCYDILECLPQRGYGSDTPTHTLSWSHACLHICTHTQNRFICCKPCCNDGEAVPNCLTHNNTSVPPLPALSFPSTFPPFSSDPSMQLTTTSVPASLPLHLFFSTSLSLCLSCLTLTPKSDLFA